MSLSKEIFGIERKQKVNSHVLCGSTCCCDEEVNSFNEALNEIDKHELSEEELAKIICKEMFNLEWNETVGSTKQTCIRYAKAIKQNKSKIFVRKSNGNNN